MSSDHSWPPEIFDIIALCSALVAGIALGPLMAFGHDDVVAADARFQQAYPFMGAHGVSTGLAVFTSLSSTLSFLSLICAVLVRGAMLFEPSVRDADKGLFRKALRPLVVLSFVPMAIAIIIFIVCFYFCGWVVLPSQVVGGATWIWAGGWLMVVITLLLFYGGALTCLLYRHTRRETAGAHVDLPEPGHLGHL